MQEKLEMSGKPMGSVRLLDMVLSGDGRNELIYKCIYKKKLHFQALLTLTPVKLEL